MKKVAFDELISKGKLTDAARGFAKEYYDAGKMGHTRKLLIEQLADKVDRIEKGWEPINKNSPTEEGMYIVTFDDGFVTAAEWFENEWQLWADSGEVVAWMPVPEPYKEEK